jgi:hypothetical protein
MPAVVSKITEGRGRAAAVLTIEGEGFSILNNNTVTFDGIPAILGAQALTSIVATVPGGLVANRHAVVLVTNVDDGTSATWWWWVKPSIAALASFVLPVVVPGIDELESGLQNSNMRIAEAKYFERIAAVLELIPYDLLTAKGALVGMGSAGLEQVAPGLLGEILASFPSGPAFGPRLIQSLRWGRQLAAANLAVVRMEAGGLDSDLAVSQGSELVLAAGRLAVACVYCRSSATSRVVEINVLVNGITLHTEGPLPGIRGGQFLTFFPDLPLAAGDTVEIEIRKNNAFSAWLGQAYGSIV